MRLHRLGKKSKGIFDKDFFEILTTELFSVTIGLIAGVLLLSITDKLKLIPALLVFIPGFHELHGSVISSLAARLSTDLHLKKISRGFHFSKIMNENILASVLLALSISFLLGIFAYFLTFFIFKEVSLSIILISVIASFITLVISIPMTLVALFWSFNKGHDPDDIMGPYVTTLVDIIGMVVIFVVITII